jgi:hypothetical protein
MVYELTSADRDAISDYPKDTRPTKLWRVHIPAQTFETYAKDIERVIEIIHNEPGLFDYESIEEVVEEIPPKQSKIEVADIIKTWREKR